MKRNYSILMLSLLVPAYAGAISSYRIQALYRANPDNSIYISNSGATASESGSLWDDVNGYSVIPPGGGYIRNFTRHGVVVGEIGEGNNRSGFAWTRNSGYTYYRSHIPTGGDISDMNTAGIAVGIINRGMFGEPGALGIWAAGNTTAPAYNHHIGSGGNFQGINDNNWVWSGGGNSRFAQIGGPQRIATPLSGNLNRSFIHTITNSGFIFGTSSTSAGTYTTEVWNLQGASLFRSSREGIEPFQLRSVAEDGTALCSDSRFSGNLEGPMSLWNPFTGQIATVSSLLEPSSENWTEIRYQRMNNSLQIVGTAKNGAGETYAIRLNPVPEPATMLVLAAGLAGVLKRRKSRV